MKVNKKFGDNRDDCGKVFDGKKLTKTFSDSPWGNTEKEAWRE